MLNARVVAYVGGIVRLKSLHHYHVHHVTQNVVDLKLGKWSMSYFSMAILSLSEGQKMCPPRKLLHIQTYSNDRFFRFQ